MGLHTATILVLSPKDKKRRRYRNQSEIENNKKNDNTEKNENYEKNDDNAKNKNDEENDNNEKNTNDETNNTNDKNGNDEIENESYYSNDYCEEIDDIPHQSFQLGLNDEIESTKVWHKDQIYQSEIESIRNELKLGHGDWVYEAWVAFVYCFNKRLSYLNIQFDPTNDYKDASLNLMV